MRALSLPACRTVKLITALSQCRIEIGAMGTVYWDVGLAMACCTGYPGHKTVSSGFSSRAACPIIIIIIKSKRLFHATTGPAAPPELAEGSPDLKPTGAASEATARPQAHADIQEEEEDGDDDDYLASQGVSLVDTSAGSTPKAGGGLYGLGAQRSGMLRGVQE